MYIMHNVYVGRNLFPHTFITSLGGGILCMLICVCIYEIRALGSIQRTIVLVLRYLPPFGLRNGLSSAWDFTR